MFSKTPEQRGRLIVNLLASSDYDPAIDGRKISSLLRKGADFRGFTGLNHALTLAIFKDHADLLHHCITHRIELNADGLFGSPALIMALDVRKGEVARRLINNGASLNCRDRQSRTPLMLALRAGDLTTARVLIRKRQSVEYVISRGYGSVNAAIDSGNPAVLDFILKAGAPLKMDINPSYNPIAYAVQTEQSHMLEILLKAGAQPDFAARLDGGKTLMKLAQEKSPDCYKKLRQLKAAQDAKSKAEKQKKDSAWQLVGASEVAIMHPPGTLPYHVTEIFNFSTGIYTRINRNAKTGAESSAMLDFQQISRREVVEQAAQELINLGGQMPEGAAIAAPRSLLGKPVAKEKPACS